MKSLLALFLSCVLSFNAAYAVTTDICDMLEQHSGHSAAAASLTHGEHFGHHSHDHEHASVANSNDQGAPDQSTQSTHADHCHPHQCFTSVLPGELLLPRLTGNNLVSVGPDDQVVTLPPSRLERPPRGSLA